MFEAILVSMALGANPSTDLSLLGTELALDRRVVQKSKLVVRDRGILRAQRQVIIQRNVNVVEQRQVFIQQNVLRASAYPVFSAQLQVQQVAYPVAALQVQQYLAMPVQSFQVYAAAPVVIQQRLVMPGCR